MPSRKLNSSNTRSLNGNPKPYFDNTGKRWRAVGYYTNTNGKRLKVCGSGKTKTIAVANRDSLISNAVRKMNSTLEPIQVLTVSSWLDHYMNVHRLDTWSYSTRVGYEHVLKAWINPSLGNMKLDDCSIEDIEKLYLKVGKAGYSRSTLNQIRSLIKPAFDLAIRRGHMKSNPADQVPLPKKVKAIPTYLNYEQTRCVLSQAANCGELANWGIALGLGLRQGERLALRWSDIELDADSPHIIVRHTLQRQTGNGLVLKSPKTAKSQRLLPLTPELVMALKQRKALQNADRLRAGINWNDTDYVFTTELGRAIDPRNDFRKWEKLLADSGVDYVKLHAARHTAATLMVVGGTPLHTVSEILGHSSIAVTADIYAHVTSAQSSTALNLLSLQIFPSDGSPIELAT